MPIEVLSGEDCLANLKKNPQARHPRPDFDRERLFPFPLPVCRPTFQITRDDAIFAMGSCFAQEIEETMRAFGFNIISRDVEGSKEKRWHNKYNVFSINDELRWALNPATPYPGKHVLLKAGSEGWFDLQVRAKYGAHPLEDLLNFRRSYVREIARIVEADVIILTLGIAEAWYDKATDLYLNGGPSPAYVLYPGRFELRVLSYDDVLESLETMHELVMRYCKKTVKFLVTVSPVPLHATYRNQDVLIANTYSKSVQRAAVEKFVLSHDNVDYFPSYEFAVIGGLQIDRTSDFRHVAPRTVNRIMSNVLVSYLPENETKFIAATIKDDFRGIVRLAEKTDLANLHVTDLYLIGQAYQRLRRYDKAMDVFLDCLERWPDKQSYLESAMFAAARSDNRSVLDKLLTKHQVQYPERGFFRERIRNIFEKGIGRKPILLLRSLLHRIRRIFENFKNL